MNAVQANYQSKLTIEQHCKVDQDDQFNVELSRASNIHRSTGNQDVYFDHSTGKIVVALKKKDKTTGVKRPLDCEERKTAIRNETGSKNALTGVSIGARVLKKIKSSNAKSETVHYVQESGSSYATTDRKSDVVLKNRPDPYAFIQFNPIVT